MVVSFAAPYKNIPGRKKEKKKPAGGLRV